MKTIFAFIERNVPSSMQLESIYVCSKCVWSAFFKTTYESLLQPGVLVKVYVSPSGPEYY